MKSKASKVAALRHHLLLSQTPMRATSTTNLQHVNATATTTASAAGAVSTKSPVRSGADKVFNVYELIQSIFKSEDLDLQDILQLMRINKKTYNVAKTADVIENKGSWILSSGGLRREFLYDPLAIVPDVAQGAQLSIEELSRRAMGMGPKPHKRADRTAPLQKLVDFRKFGHAFTMSANPKQVWEAGKPLLIELRFTRTPAVPAQFLVTVGRTVISVNETSSEAVWRRIAVGEVGVRVRVTLGEDTQLFEHGVRLGEVHDWLCQQKHPKPWKPLVRTPYYL